MAGARKPSLAGVGVALFFFAATESFSFTLILDRVMRNGTPAAGLKAELTAEGKGAFLKGTFEPSHAAVTAMGRILDLVTRCGGVSMMASSLSSAESFSSTSTTIGSKTCRLSCVAATVWKF